MIIFRRRNNLHEVRERLNLLLIFIVYIRTSSKAACSARPIVDLLLHRNVWKRGVAWGKNVPQQKRVCTPRILLLYVKRAIDTPSHLA